MDYLRLFFNLRIFRPSEHALGIPSSVMLLLIDLACVYQSILHEEEHSASC